MPKSSATARARKIKLILFDVDGVLTDGKIWIFPAPGGRNLEFSKVSSNNPRSMPRRAASGFRAPA